MAAGREAASPRRSGPVRSRTLLSAAPLGARRVARVDVTPEQMKIALKDAELMLELLRDRPDEMRSLYNDVVAGRTDAVKETATRIGLSESSFRERGGRCGATRDEIVSFDLTGLRTTVPR